MYGSGTMIQSHVYVLNNTHGLFIVLFNVILGSGLLKAESIGVLLSICGVVCMIADPSAERSDGDTGTYFDYLMVLGSAVFGALYFLMSAKNVKALPICLLLFMMNLHSFFLCSLMAKFSDSSVEIFSIDPVNGCFGFLNRDNLFIALIPYGILASFCGSAGYVLCLLWYSPVVTSNSYLIEPFIAQALGFWFGIDAMPGLLTLVGTLLAIAGIMFLQMGNNERQLTKKELEGDNYALADGDSQDNLHLLEKINES